MRIVIKKAGQPALLAVADMIQKLFAIEDDFLFDRRKVLRGLRLLLDEPKRASIFTAQIQGIIIGMCTVQMVISTAAGGFSARIEDVFVENAYRKQGIGSLLLYAAERWAYGKHCCRLELVADSRNRPALRFYQKHSFMRTRLIRMQKIMRA